MSNFGTLMTGKKMSSLFDGKENVIYKKGGEGGKPDNTKLLRIVNDDPIELGTTVRRTLTTTNELAMQINQVLKPVFSDWYGSEIIIQPNGRIDVRFVFKAINGGDIDRRVFVPVEMTVEKTSNSIADQINIYSAMRRDHNMEYTSWGAELIYDLMRGDAKRNVNPTKIETMRNTFSETSENVNNGFSMVNNIYCTVEGLDIYRILGVVFGVKDEEGNAIKYNINPIKPVSNMNIGRANYVIDIERMSTKDYNIAMAKIGYQPIPGAITAITGTLDDLR